MKTLWSWLSQQRELPGPLRYLDVFKLRRFVTLKRVVIVVCVVVGLHTVLNIETYAVLEHQLRRARAAGVKLNIRQYDEPEVKMGQNAAHLYVAAFELLASMETEDTDVPGTVRDEWPQAGPPSAELQEKMNSFVNSKPVSLALELIEEGNRMPKCNWGLRYEDTFAMLIPHLAGVRSGARALLVRARLRYVTGDAPGALGDLKAVRELAKRIESDRIIISELVQYAVLDLWVTAVRQMSSAQHPDAETARHIADLLTPWEELIGTTGALKVEVAAAYFWTQQARGNPEELMGIGAVQASIWNWPAHLGASYPYRPLYRLDQAQLVRLELDLVDLSQEPYYTARERLEELSTELESLPRPYVLTRGLAPALTKLQMAVARAQAWVRTARIGLALETYRAQTGSYPDSLSALVPGILPEVPVDPFTDTPLLYRLSDVEVLVYSVGSNGIDDGGLKETEKAGKKLNPGTDDIAWRVRR